MQQSYIMNVLLDIPSVKLLGHVDQSVSWLTGPRGLCHTIAGILCELEYTSEGSITLATVGASKRLLSDMYLIWCMLYGQL